MRLSSYLNGFDEISRRRFAADTARGLLGLGAMPLLARAAAAQDPQPKIPLRPATAKSVIYLYMSGGMSHLDTFDPKPGTETQGPIEAIGTNVDGIQVSEHFPNMARQMDKVAVINSVQSNQGAHAQGRYLMHTSYPMRGTIRHPSLGAWLELMAGKRNPSLPGHVSVGGDIYGASGGFLESEYYPLPIGDPAAGLQNSQRPPQVTVERFHERLSRVERMNEAFLERYDQKAVRAYTEMYDQAIKLMGSRDLEAFDITKEPDDLRAAYGSDRFGQGCLLARRLVEHGVRFIEVVSGGWDTHNQNFEALEDLGPALDRTLATLLVDLESRGMLEETLVVLATEFGRTPRIVESRMGRNHYPKAFTCLLAGGGIRGGQRYGKTDELGEEIIEDKLSVEDFNATIAYGLGLPLDHVVNSPSRRPFTVAHKGKPATVLFA
jgi:hypothetical protein